MKTDKNAEEKIRLYFEEHKQEIIEQIFRLVRIKSVTQFRSPPHPFGDDCAVMLDEGIKLAQELGFETENYDYYAATATKGDTKNAIALGVHLDVVPEGEGWQICPPYEPCIHDGLLVGRGVLDDKGPAVISFYVAKCIEELGFPMKHGIKIVMGVNEEKGSNCVDYYVKNTKTPPVFSIVPDATFPVTNGEKGMVFLTLKTPELEGNIVDAGGGTATNCVPDSAYVVLSGLKASELPQLKDCISAEDTDEGVKISAKGLSSHAAEPEKGINAIGLLFDYLGENNLITGSQAMLCGAVKRICSDCNGRAFGVPLEDEPSGKLTHIFGVFKKQDNIFTLQCNMRYPVTADGAAMEAPIRKAAEEMGLLVGFYKNVRPSYIPDDDPAIKCMMDVYHNLCPDGSKSSISGGGTYARVLPRGVAYGVEFPYYKSPFGEERGHMHQPDECIPIDDLFMAARIITEAVLNLDDIV